MSLEALRAQATPGRLDHFWAETLSQRSITRAKIQDWIKAGHATVDSVVVIKPSYKLRGGESLELTMPEGCAAPEAEEGGLVILYQDEDLAILDKPFGLTVHPAPSCPEGTLVNRLLHHFPQLKRIDGERPGIVHRIDKDTTGLLAVALKEPVRLKLSVAFAEREVKKTYLALLHGRPAKDEATIDAPVGRDSGHKTRMGVVPNAREAVSSYRIVWTSRDKRYSMAEVDIATGRTHQIRVHMAHVGHPLLGDSLYGPHKQGALKREDPMLFKLASRQMLHAWKLSFTHPVSGDAMDFTCRPPRDFWRIPLHLCRKLQRVGVLGLPGSGKSTVLEALADRKWATWSADRCVADLYQPGADCWHMLRSRYGERFVADAESPVDKAALFEAMRASESFRRELMDVLYPMVQHKLRAFWDAQAKSRAAFAEVPMLLEAGWLGSSVVDLAVGVSCPTDVRHARLAEMRGWDEATIAQFDSWQWPEAKKLGACRHVVDNSGSIEQTREGVDELLTKLRRERAGEVGELLTWLRSQDYA